MVTTHGDTELAAHHDVALHDHGTLFNAADRKNTSLGWIDDRREVVDAEHAQVRDREGRARVFVRLEPPLARAAGEFARLLRDLAKSLLIGVKNDGRYQAIFDRHGHAEVDTIEVAHVVA